MTSTEHTTDPATAELVIEQGEHAEHAEVELAQPVIEDEALELSEGIGAALLISLIGGMALVLAILTPVAGVRIGGLLILAGTVVVAARLLRRGGGSR